MHSRKYQQGVNLIELMIVVTIVAILGAIAYPSYRNQLLRSHRADAKAALLEIQVTQEKRFLQSNAYVTTTAGISNTWASGGLGLRANSANNYYSLTIDAGATATSYTARATPNASQSDDTHCAAFTVDQSGGRNATNTDCW